MKKLASLDLVTKILLIGLIIFASYFIFFSILQLLFLKNPRTMTEMMERMMGINQGYSTLNFLSLMLAFLVGILFSLKLKTQPERVNELAILQKALSEDEKKIIDELKNAGSIITQDSLRFRLDWSKAKVSRILTQLDKMNLIQRERIGKTYKIHLQKRK